ncbi:MAG: SprT family zinc-dependent metalloprotease [Candidatus Sungiibacteriota bacterium]
MKKYSHLENMVLASEKEFEYAVRVSGRARRMRLTVYRDARVVVTVPRLMDASGVARFVASKVRWILDKLERFRRLPAGIVTGGTKRDFLKYKERAFALVRDRVAYFNRMYGLRFNKISIKNQRTLWGSCSRKGNLNFNYKIVLLPPLLADYIIVHELCHLAEFSHSRAFWNLVRQAIPDHKAMRRALRKNGAGFC